MEMKLNQSLIDQINKAGQLGWKFICQTQRINGAVMDIKGMPQITITLIYEKTIPEPC